MYCKNCGAELSEGARFCKKCGTPVEAVNDGFVAPESEANKPADGFTPAQADGFTAAPSNGFDNPAERQAARTFYEYGAAVGGVASGAPYGQTVQRKEGGILDILKRFFKAPVDTLEYANEKSGISVFILVVACQALIGAIFATIDMARLSNEFSVFGYSYYDTADIVAAFFGGLIGAIVAAVVELFLYFGAGAAFGSKGALKQWLPVVGTASIPTVIGAFLGGLLGMASTYVGLFIQFAFGAASMFLLYEGFAIHTRLSRTRRFYAFLIATAVLLLLAFILVRWYIGSLLGSFGF